MPEISSPFEPPTIVSAAAVPTTFSGSTLATTTFNVFSVDAPCASVARITTSCEVACS